MDIQKVGALKNECNSHACGVSELAFIVCECLVDVDTGGHQNRQVLEGS